jgi:phosphoribosylanthranilate isomerase
MTGVKICGLTRMEDAEAAVRFGADYVGFVLWPQSPRAATLKLVNSVRWKLPKHVTPVGVFVNPSVDEIRAAHESGIRIAQIHGELPDFGDERPRVGIVRAVHLAADREGIEPEVPDTEDIILLDAHDPVKHGGTGKTVDWARAAAVARSRLVFLAGGLTPDNVQQAILEVKPMAVDVASGVESAPGIKDHEKLRAFIERAKEQV